MTHKQIRDLINQTGVYGWNYVQAAGKQTLTVHFFNNWSGVEVLGCTGTLKNQLHQIGSIVREVLMSDCEENFPNHQGVRLTVDGTVPSPTSPYPPQVPAPPPVIIQPLPDTTPLTTNDRIYYV